MGNGKLIVFEGVDFCGKTTQLDFAEAFLKEKGQEVVRFREPGGTKTGERIRELLLDKAQVEMRPMTEVLLFFASRVQLIEEKVLPAIEAGKTVLLDRYYYSSAAYQGPFLGTQQDGHFRPGWVLYIAERQLRLPRPDLVIYLDGDPKKLAPRKSGERDRFEERGIEFQEAVRNAYLAMVDDIDGFRIVSAEQPIEKVRQQIEEILGGMEECQTSTV